MISNELLKKKILDQAFTGQLIDNQITFEKNGYYPIPNQWNWLRLKDVVKIVNGFTPLRSEKTFWNKNEINWFTIEDIREQGHYINHTKQYITSEALGKSLDRLLPPKTVLICCTASVGETAISEISLTTNQQFNGLIIKEEYKDVVNPYYLFHYSKTLKDKLILKAGKTTINFVSTKKLGELLIPIPPLEEQEKIVKKIDVLFELVDKKEKNDKEKEKLKTLLKEKILDSAIHGELVENNLSLPIVDVEEVKENVPFEIPNNWKWSKLGRISDYGKNKKVKGINISKDEWILELEDIEKNTGKILNKIYQADRNAISDKNIFFEGNLLYGKLRPYLNKCVIADEDGFCCTEIEPIILNSNIEAKYIQRVLMSKYFLNYVTFCSYGAKMPRLGTKDAKNAMIPIPPLEQQKKIVEKIERCFDLIEQL